MNECAICGSRKGLINHHISYEPEVTQVLCKSCHGKVHTSEDVPKRPKNYRHISSALTKLTKEERETPNISKEILRVIEMNPRITPSLIQEYIEHAPNMSLLQIMLKTLRDLSLVETLQHGVYEITDKGVETLRTSEKNQSPNQKAKNNEN